MRLRFHFHKETQDLKHAVKNRISNIVDDNEFRTESNPFGCISDDVSDVCLIYSSVREPIGMHRILRILWEIACRLRLNQHAPASSNVRIEMTARP